MSIVFSDRFRYTLIVSSYKERIFLKHSLIRFSAVVLTIAFVFALTGCGSGSNSFTWFVDSIPANLDPQVASASADVIACENLYAALSAKIPAANMSLPSANGGRSPPMASPTPSTSRTA